MKKIVKLILTIGITLGYIAGVAGFMEKYYMFLYGKDAVFYTNNDFFAVQVLAFLIFFGIMLYFWSKDGLRGLEYGSDDGIKAEQKPLQKAKMTVAAAAILLAVNLICMHCYHRITPDGIEVHFLFRTKNYTWDDVDYYTLNTHIMDDTLSMKMIMKDGRKIDLLPSVLLTESDGFVSDFQDEEYDFLPWLNEKLIKKRKLLKIGDEKKLLQKLKKYEAWESLAADLITSCQAAGTFGPK